MPIGVRQQSAYQRRTLLDKRRQRTASVPAVSFTRPTGIWKMSAPPAGYVRPFEETRERLAVLAIADKTEAGVGRNFASDAAHATAPAAKRKILKRKILKRKILKRKILGARNHKA